MNQASNSTDPITQELAVPAASGEQRCSATPLTRFSGTLGALRFALRERQFRTTVELWALEVILFSFAVLRRLGYQ